LILLDTSGLLSAIDSSQTYHRECAKSLEQSGDELILSPFVLAELDCMLFRHVGQTAQFLFLEQVIASAYKLVEFGASDLSRAKEVMERYSDLSIGLADASIVVLAERYQSFKVLTLDQRHFRAIRVGRRRFSILPFD
jgi:uncharacterized protein